MASETVLKSVNNPYDAELMKEAQRCIMAALAHTRTTKILLVDKNYDVSIVPTAELPSQALRAIANLLGLMAQQQPIVLITQKREFSTQEAANFLNVSRPFVIKEIENGRLHCRKVGRHRRVEFDELLRYQKALRDKSHTALKQLRDLSQELGLGY